jgi:hypothetical protein
MRRQKVVGLALLRHKGAGETVCRVDGIEVLV